MRKSLTLAGAALLCLCGVAAADPYRPDANGPDDGAYAGEGFGGPAFGAAGAAIQVGGAIAGAGVDVAGGALGAAAGFGPELDPPIPYHGREREYGFGFRPGYGTRYTARALDGANYAPTLEGRRLGLVGPGGCNGRVYNPRLEAVLGPPQPVYVAPAIEHHRLEAYARDPRQACRSY